LRHAGRSHRCGRPSRVESVATAAQVLHQRWFVRPAIRQDMRRSVSLPPLVRKLLLQGHEPLAKRFPCVKSLGLLTAIGADDDGDVLASWVV
jgi:hypothetical protein